MDDYATRIAAIAADARSLAERLAVCVAPPVAVAPERLAAVRASWLAALAAEDAVFLDRRLAWDGIDAAALERVIANHAPPVDPSVGWPALFAILIGAEPDPLPAEPDGPHADLVAAILATPADAARDAAKPLPFEEVWLPLIARARRRLVDRLGRSRITPTSTRIAVEARAHAAFERDLLVRLCEITGEALLAAFDTVRPRDVVLRGRFLGAAAVGRTRYDTFVTGLRGEGLLAFFEAHPVAARLVATVVEDWIEATAEVHERLAADADALVATFPVATASRRVVAARAGLSDPHRGGRRVAILEFEGGGAVVLKPKPLASEAALFRILAWLGGRLPTSPPRVLACLDRGSHGWVEHVTAAPCRDAKDETRFYENAGVLLAVLHLLGVNDCHRENLIAAGRDPVFVDGETVMHPEPAASDPVFGWVRRAAFDRSVVRTGLLPRWMVDAENRIVTDITALGGGGEGQSAFSERGWGGLGSDAIHRRPEAHVYAETSRPEPVSGLSAHARGAAMANGFDRAHHVLADHRDELLGPGGPIAGFAHVEVRFIYRPTAVYAALLERSRSPAALADGLATSLVLDGVARAHLDGPEPPDLWPTVAHERAALERLDVPVFLVPADGHDLPIDGGASVAGFFPRSGLETAIDRLEALDQADRVLQAATRRGPFAARAAGSVDPASLAPATDDDDPTEMPLDRDELLDEARRIADRIEALAHIDRDGHRHWLGLREIEGTGRQQLAPLDDALHAGSVGIALFFATLARATGEDAWADRAAAAVARVRRRIADPAEAATLVADGAIGGGLGFGSILFGLARIAEILDDPALGREVAVAAVLIDDARIAEDRGLDVMSGSAGAVLGLLAAEAQVGDGRALERAIACGRHLLTHRESVHDGPRGWRGHTRRALTGFSHGAAGIAHALSRLAEVSGEAAFRVAAEEGIAFESRHYRPDLGNWPDLRDGVGRDDAPAFATGWCHGAPGIALARLATPSLLADPMVCAEVDAAIETTCACGAAGLDHACCGTMGRIDTLLLAARVRGREDLVDRARRTAARVVRRARLAGDYRFPGLAAGDHAPGLFTGLAGIGHQLLRLRDPDEVPSMLLWSRFEERTLR